MKVKLKNTGEIINIADYARVTLDKCNSYGNPIELNFEDVEFIEEKTDDIDWEQRRSDMAENFISVLLGRLNYDPFTVHLCCCSSGDPVNPYSYIAKIAVSVADALINELKTNKKY